MVLEVGSLPGRGALRWRVDRGWQPVARGTRPERALGPQAREPTFRTPGTTPARREAGASHSATSSLIVKNLLERPTMSNFANLDLAALVTVTGGADGAPNTSETKGSGNVGVTYKGTKVGVQLDGSTSTTRTDPAQCASDVRQAGGTPTDILKCYGK
jgi:hypothetical protein